MPNVFTPRFTSEGIWQNPIYYTPNSYPEMPNCTNYAYGRYWEITGQNPTGLQYLGDGGSWYANVPSTFRKGLTPALGAIVCTGAPGWAGHVAVVEQILANGDIITSNSGYRRPLTSYPPSMEGYFWTETCYKDAFGANQYLSSWEASRGYRLRGFIYADSYAPSPTSWVYRISDVASVLNLNQSERENNATIIYSILTYEGWTLSAIAGMLGSATRESTLNPGACEIGRGIPVTGSDYYGAGCGLVGLTDYPPYTATYPHPILWNANRLGEDWWDGNFQVEMLTHATDPTWTQLGTGASRWGWNMGIQMPDKLSWDEYIHNTLTPERSAYNWFFQFEAGIYPDPDGTLPERQANARYWYDWLQGIAPVPPPYNPDYTRKMPTWMKVKPHRRRLI